MPYINQEDRPELDEHIDKLVEILNQFHNNEMCGKLNYIISKLMWKLCGFKNSGRLRYDRLNTVVGAIELAKLEFQRRIIVPYEAIKIKINGDIDGKPTHKIEEKPKN